jgi:hypothetical protein
VYGSPWLRGGILAHLDEAIGRLPLDAFRLLEPDFSGCWVIARPDA